ncbi:hypothetical protein SBA2_680007 [Acidobacteriia bacterium SbA2]|nr:hypothetical protein SBA2_680007 [Acidobacteriia bacterium SbA2]
MAWGRGAYSGPVPLFDALSVPAVRPDYFFHDAFRHASKSPHAGSLLIHRTKEPSTLGIDEGDFAEVYDNRLVWRVIFHRAPASFQFVHPGARQFSFQVQRGRIRRIVSGNFQHHSSRGTLPVILSEAKNLRSPLTNQLRRFFASLRMTNHRCVALRYTKLAHPGLV